MGESSGESATASDPQYTGSGSLLFPQDYREWTFVTSGLGMTYRAAGASEADANPSFDNVFADPASYKSFLKTGVWRDKTVLILEIRESDSKVSINKGGHVQTQLLRVEAHVKDSARRGWAFYAFKPGETEAKMLPKTLSCYSCHDQNGATDSTFVQFYPTLAEAAIRGKTFKTVNH